MSALIEEDLRAMIQLRWQLCDGDATAAADKPFNAAWARSVMLTELIHELYREVKHGSVAGLVAPGELEGLGRVVDAAQAHAGNMTAVMAAAGE